MALIFSLGQFFSMACFWLFSPAVHIDGPALFFSQLIHIHNYRIRIEMKWEFLSPALLYIYLHFSLFHIWYLILLGKIPRCFPQRGINVFEEYRPKGTVWSKKKTEVKNLVLPSFSFSFFLPSLWETFFFCSFYVLCCKYRFGVVPDPPPMQTCRTISTWALLIITY